MTRAVMGTLTEQNLRTLLESAQNGEWSGALRIKRISDSGIVWLVRGEIAHAETDGDETIEGMQALENMIAWSEGSYLLDSDLLPPSRSIRLPMMDIISGLDQSKPARKLAEMYVPQTLTVRLEQVLKQIREQMPELKSLTFVKDNIFEATTMSQDPELDWVDRQLKSLKFDAESNRETMYIEREGKSLFILRQGKRATVLSAEGRLEPQSLMWAAEEAVRSIETEIE